MTNELSLDFIAYAIFNTVRPQISDDDAIDIREIKFAIHNQRALWLRNEFNKNRSIDPALIQDLGCVNLITVDNSDCCDIDSGCVIKRSVNKIPVPIELHQRTAITHVGSIDKMQSRFGHVPYSRAIYANNGRYTKNMIYAFLLNGYMYFTSSQDNVEFQTMSYANIKGVFENPQDAGRFTTCSGQVCYDDKDSYPINRWMIPYISAEVVKGLLAVKLTSPTDNTNDAKNTDGKSSVEQREG